MAFRIFGKQSELKQASEIVIGRILKIDERDPLIREAIQANVDSYRWSREIGLFPMDVAAALERNQGVLSPEVRRLTYEAARDWRDRLPIRGVRQRRETEYR